MARLNSYAEAARLDGTTLRALVADGDGPERVWAAWALALRASTGRIAPEFDHLRSDPDPGVRSHAVVFLAATGDHRGVAVLAAADPAEEVRATACRLIWRLRREGEAEAASELGARLLADRNSYVRCAILDEVRRNGAPLSFEAVQVAAGDPDVAVRRAAVQVVVERLPGDIVSLAKGRLGVEPDAGIEQEVIRAAMEGPQWAELVASLPSFPSSVVRKVLAQGSLRGSNLDERLLLELAARADFALDLAMLNFIETPPSPTVARWLVLRAGDAHSAMEGPSVVGTDRPMEFLMMATELIATTAAALGWNPAPPEFREPLLRLCGWWDRLMREEAYWNSYGDGEDDSAVQCAVHPADAAVATALRRAACGPLV